MKTSTRNPQATRPARRRSRFGYDHQWWGEPAPVADDRATSYWVMTRRPVPSLTFVAPILLAYELGVVWIGGASADRLRTGADAWLRGGLAALGFTDRWLLPLGLVIALLLWQAKDRGAWRFRPIALLAMVGESLALAVALVGFSRLLDLGFLALERSAAPMLAASVGGHGPAALLVGFLGAGVYEEMMFRLALIPLFYGALRLLMTPSVLACSIAVTASSLLFSLAHHAGTPGEAFTWFAFIFRWLAGVYFAWVFVVRGFGVAVGTHTAYDLLVGWLGWHF